MTFGGNMTRETHEKGGHIFALLALPSLYNNYLIDYNFTYKIILLFIYAYFASLGSLVPDIDMKGSYISKKFLLVHKIFGKKLRHRGFTHSFLFMGILTYFAELTLTYTDNNIVFICLFSGLITGTLSHICLDLFTKEGVELLYPISVNFSVLPIKTSSKLEKNICKVLHLLVVFLLGYRFYLFI